MDRDAEEIAKGWDRVESFVLGVARKAENEVEEWVIVDTPFRKATDLGLMTKLTGFRLLDFQYVADDLSKVRSRLTPEGRAFLHARGHDA